MTQAEGLNPPQREAALHAGGPLLVFAGAGSGKTRTITFRIANLLATHSVAPYRILAVTFTNKAAQEMRHRLAQLVGEELTRDLWVGTFHGICAKFLRREHEAVGLTRNFVIYDDSDQRAIVARLIKEFELDDRRYVPRAVLSAISGAKSDGRDPAEHDLGDGFDPNLVRLGREYQAALRRSNAVDFDDLLLYVLRLVEDQDSPAGRNLCARFEHVLVDEFQDTNWVQYRIVRALSGRTRNLCVVGDDDQSIYRWRGADVRIIRGFKKDFPETLVVKLEQNYRSTANIVKAALGVIAPAMTREPKELWTLSPPGPPVVVHGGTDERDEAAFVTRGLLAARGAGISPAELAVFYRVHAQSRVLEEALRGANLPYQIIGGTKFFDRAEIKDMLAYLRLIENPASDTDFLRVVNVPARGIGQKTVERLMEVAASNTQCLSDALVSALSDGSLAGGAAPKFARFRDLLDELRLANQRLSPSELLERTLEATGYRALLEKEDSAESDARLENLAELVGSMREYESEAPETGEAPTLSGYLERVSLVSPTDAMKDEPKVSLMTVHAAKGLEFEHVWLTGMEEETFPYRGLDGSDPEELDEERRLAYVAITRAKKRLFVSHVGSRFLFGKTRYLAQSRFLADLPADAIERSGQTRHGTGGFAGSGFAGSGFAGSGFAGSGQGSGSRSGSGYAGGFKGSRSSGAAPSWASLGGERPRGPSEMRLSPGERVIDRSEASDPGVDAEPTPNYEEGESIVVRPGQRVSHKKFGRGTVVSLEPGVEPRVVARFPGHGPKLILAKYLDFE
jgi:DNA helicase-2/ATP-dependent DNA helicase PcrA